MWKSGINQFLCSSIAGGVSAALIQIFQTPVDLMNMIIYSQHPNQPIPFISRLFCYYRLLQDEGVLNYIIKNGYKKVIRSTLLSGIHFSVKDTLKSLFFQKEQVSISTRRLLLGSLTSGGISGIIGLILLYYLDFQMIVQLMNPGNQSNRNQSSSNQMKQLFTGFCFSLPGVFVYRAIWFGFYDVSKQIIWGNVEKQNKASLLLKFFLAYLSTIAASTFASPFDNIRRGLMIQQQQSRSQRIGIFGLIKLIFQKEGINGFFKGNSLSLGKHFNQSLVLVVFDFMKRILLKI